MRTKSEHKGYRANGPPGSGALIYLTFSKKLDFNLLTTLQDLHIGAIWILLWGMRKVRSFFSSFRL